MSDLAKPRYGCGVRMIGGTRNGRTHIPPRLVGPIQGIPDCKYPLTVKVFLTGMAVVSCWLVVSQ